MTLSDLEHGAGHVADAFCASRLAADTPFGGGAFGALPGNTDFGALLARAWPEL